MRSGRTLLIVLALIFHSMPGMAADTTCAPAELSSVHIIEDTATFHIDITYPVLCQPHATRIIRNHVTKTLSDFKKDFPEPAPRPFHYKHEMLSQYTTWTCGHTRLASVKLQTMVYTGGAHPNHWLNTWVFDLTDGQILTLEDIFPDTQAALEHIAEAVRPKLKQKIDDMYVQSMFDDGTAPTRDNYRYFILSENGITFFFPPYQIAPYAAGQQTATLPFPSFTQYLSPTLAFLHSMPPTKTHKPHQKSSYN